MSTQVQVSPPLEAQECVCAVSSLWWCQQLAADERLWDVVAKSSKALKEEKSKKSGLAYWHRVQKDFWTPPYTVSVPFKYTIKLTELLGIRVVLPIKIWLQQAHIFLSTFCH